MPDPCATAARDDVRFAAFRRMWHRRFVREALQLLLLSVGNGASTAISFATVVALARLLPPAEFVLVNLALTLMVVGLVAGGGADNAAVRWIVRGEDRGRTLGHAFVLRVVVAGVVATLGAVVVLPATQTADVNPATAIASSIAVCLGGVALSMFVVVAHADRSFRQYVGMQIAYYGLLATPVAWLWWQGGSVEGLLIAQASVALAALTWLLFRRGMRFRAPRGERRRFTRLAAVLVLGSALFAVSERIDLLMVSALASPEVAAQFAVGQRYASAMVVVTGAFAAWALPRMAALRDGAELRDQLRSLRVLVLLVACCGVLGASLSPIALPLMFGASYSEGAVLVAVVLIAQYPALAYQTWAIACFPHLGRARWVAQLGLILLVTKAAAAIVLVQVGPVALAGASLVGHAAATAYAYVRVGEMLAGSHGQAPAASSSGPRG